MTKEKFYTFTITLLASIRVLFERVKANERAYKAFKIASVILLAVLVLWADALISGRVAQKKALDTYRTWFEEYKAEQEAEALSEQEKDPYIIQLKHEATYGAQALEGIKLYHYDNDAKRTFLQGIANRVLNPAYPNTVEEVLFAKGQFEMFDPSNPVTEENYQLCYEFFDSFHKQERLTCSYDLVFVELAKDKVVLRDTFAKTYDTQTWWYGK